MKVNKFNINQHVRILLYPEGDINEKGRIQFYNKETGLYRVVNMNMPYQGTVSAWFSPYELEAF